MREKMTCPHCKDIYMRFYDGAIGYEAIFCHKCGYFEDHDTTGKDDSFVGKSGPETIYRRED